MEGSVLTPWGRSDQLRERRLPPGPGKKRADVQRSQRERLFGATVAVVDEEGYEGMSVGAIAARAGISRRTFYEHFDGGLACFLATFEALMEEELATLSRAYRDENADQSADADSGDWQADLNRALATLFDDLVAQPAAARLCFLEAYATGSAGADLRDCDVLALEELVRDALDRSPERAGMPPTTIAAITGGIRVVAQTRLRRRREYELPGLAPELVAWLSVYETPDPPLLPPPTPARRAPAPRFVASSHRDRLFVALAKVVNEKGYAGTNVADIVAEARTSLSTFYANFQGKEDAFLAACDFGIEQAFAAVRHAWEREADAGWPHQVRAAMRELLAFLASEPEWSYTAMVELFAAGPRARARRDRTIELFTGLVEPGRALAPDVRPIVVEAVAGAVYWLMYAQIRNSGAERLPETLPTAVLVLLTPFVGGAAAAEVARGTSR